MLMATRAVPAKLSQRMDLSGRFSERQFMCCFASVFVLKEKNLLWFSGLLAAYEWRCNGLLMRGPDGWLVGKRGTHARGKVAMILLR